MTKDSNGLTTVRAFAAVGREPDTGRERLLLSTLATDRAGSRWRFRLFNKTAHVKFELTTTIPVTVTADLREFDNLPME